MCVCVRERGERKREREEKKYILLRDRGSAAQSAAVLPLKARHMAKAWILDV